ncbi:unnamed protein product [Mytilus coruscus]|uniref:YqaJ viral recombinase domain-containing protein n=1 Tax=Mytilus coruscus TaxID=42192 RepID=A0A6J8DW72_MYTCO|nr:unnamed protein product [Mytilus coruscus]
MNSKGSNVQVESVGIILLKDRPGLGASLDGIVEDPSANIIRGGLEVKYPYGKANFNINDACKDKTFFLKSENGQISLKENHNYFYQVQGQMYVANFKWVDFVVWYGDHEELFVQRILFNKQNWLDKCLSALDLFFKWAVVPELLTRRVERKLTLLSKEQWIKLQSELCE